jgi:AcrR family transcriptional regulator
VKTVERRQTLRDNLITLAERSIERHGLAGVKARDLAAEAGCSVGAIYNVVADLDDLVLTVNERTLAAIQAELAIGPHDFSGESPRQAEQQLIHLAHCYLRYAAAHRHRWRAVFDHRLPEGRVLPDWYLDRQRRMFAFVEQPLRALRPDLAAEQFALLARSLFSAVHGIVLLGLEEKIATISIAELESQITVIVTALCRGLTSYGGAEEARL